jgi:glycosyltransferase involved in cell wall biosynthesis
MLDSLPHIFRKRKWFYTAYSRNDFVELVQDASRVLGLTSVICLSWALLASGLCRKLSQTMNCVFSPDDDFLRFPQESHEMRNLYASSYAEYAEISSTWITNSHRNKLDFTNEFGIKECVVIPNGVDPERFQNAHPLPEDLKQIQRPIVGMGGSLTHLVDFNLLNFLVEKNADKSFVIVGQVLERNVLDAITKRPNLHYLGDKHYDEYPAYLSHFDVCILPYVVGEREHGGDSIKVYEYLAAGKPVVATNCNSTGNVRRFIKTALSFEHFSELIDLSLNEPHEPQKIPQEFTWKSKTDQIIKILEVCQIAN